MTTKVKTTTTWEFPNSGHPWHGGDKDNVFDIPDAFVNREGMKMPRLAFTFRAELISDVWQFLGKFDAITEDTTTRILVPVFVHSEPQLVAATVNILVQPTFKLTEKELTEEVALAELRRIMALVPDGHVMYESLAPANDYTTQRTTVDFSAAENLLNEYIK